MSAPTIERASIFTGRQWVFLVVVALHAAFIAALMAMRISVDVEPVPVLKAITQITQPRPPEEARPTLDPQVDTRPTAWKIPDVPVPMIRRDTPAQAITPPPVDAGVPSWVEGVADPVPIAIAPTGLQYRAVRSTDDYYPTVSRQLQEQGVVVVRVCVGPTGRLEGRPTVERGSGSRHLDAAAVRWASEALAFTPATRNGAAVSACKGFRVNFTLR